MVKGGMHGEGGVWQRGGACAAKGGMCRKRGNAWQRGEVHVWQRVCMVCRPPSTPFYEIRPVNARAVCISTGMHSCFHSAYHTLAMSVKCFLKLQVLPWKS